MWRPLRPSCAVPAPHPGKASVGADGPIACFSLLGCLQHEFAYGMRSLLPRPQAPACRDHGPIVSCCCTARQPHLQGHHAVGPKLSTQFNLLICCLQGNRYMPLTMHKAAAALGLRITALDRPGIGASSPQPNRTVQQYPADVAELCEQLSIKQFSIFASSAGTMYALALTLAPETKHMVVGKVRSTHLNTAVHSLSRSGWAAAR